MRLLARLRRHVHLARPFSSSPNPNPKPKPVSSSVRVAIKALCDEEDLDKLVTSFKSFATSPRFRSNHNVYKIIVRRLAVAGRIASVEDILESQKVYSDITREGFAIRLISLYARAGMLSHAAATFDQLPSPLAAPCTVSLLQRPPHSLRALIKGYLQDGKLEEAKKVYSELIKNDCAPNRWTFELLIPKLYEVGELDMALKLCYESLSQAGVLLKQECFSK
ncbi:hypothetical protein J5N97_016817 [Dioscorea zingiberensis]|uniref:Pentatricopeptide repeat-containing protein n=1 Tax=Dioscorea zingiberensis TaxID=325984 RepID=A0A9D5HG08_9LILI|nr:hypothetical protein J5N97_016817 [Dioscorea zingiberensis]